MRYNARRLGQLIDDLLSFSGIGRRELCIGAVDPASIVRDVLDDFEHLTRGRRIEFELRELASCEADAALLSLVFSNLISNAIKYTRLRDHATVVVGCEKRDGEAHYYVRDNGVGFDMRHATELFGIFQRLHARGEFEGTGVGLAIARRVVERHGGRIWADSEPDRGATFWFTLGGAGAGPRVKAPREMAVA
jgi:signal transduction histidine kinase